LGPARYDYLAISLLTAALALIAWAAGATTASVAGQVLVVLGSIAVTFVAGLVGDLASAAAMDETGAIADSSACEPESVKPLAARPPGWPHSHPAWGDVPWVIGSPRCRYGRRGAAP